MKYFFHTKFRQGYIALLSVIVVAAAATAIMTSVISSGVLATKTDFSLQQFGGARGYATSCAEEALQVILETRTTSSSSLLTFPQGFCSYRIFQNGSTLTVHASGTVGSITSKIRVLIASTTPSITLSSWEEVGDF
jgi:hypothetical protein